MKLFIVLSLLGAALAIRNLGDDIRYTPETLEWVFGEQDPNSTEDRNVMQNKNYRWPKAQVVYRFASHISKYTVNVLNYGNTND